MNLVYVISVHGGRHRIDRNKYDAGKVLLVTYNSKGGKTGQDNGYKGKGTTMLHRENIRYFCTV